MAHPRWGLVGSGSVGTKGEISSSESLLVVGPAFRGLHLLVLALGASVAWRWVRVVLVLDLECFLDWGNGVGCQVFSFLSHSCNGSGKVHG